MILECPECHSRYLVPDSAIGGQGRTVRCAACKHSWFQEPALTLDTPLAEPRASVQPPEPPTFFAAPPPADAYAQGEEPVTRPRRNPARLWTIAAAVAAVLMIAAIGAILYTGAPGLARQIGIPLGVEDSPLRLVDDPIQRRELPNGSELFAVSGKIVNPSGERQRVPDIRAELRDAQGRVVFGWTITPQQRFLASKAEVAFDSAKLDVPANSKRLELSFAGDAPH